jgi:hypothetical protein
LCLYLYLEHLQLSITKNRVGIDFLMLALQL